MEDPDSISFDRAARSTRLGQWEVMEKFLTSQPHSINVLDRTSRTLLNYALMAPPSKLEYGVSHLLQHGARVQSQPSQPIHLSPILGLAMGVMLSNVRTRFIQQFILAGARLSLESPELKVRLAQSYGAFYEQWNQVENTIDRRNALLDQSRLSSVAQSKSKPSL